MAEHKNFKVGRTIEIICAVRVVYRAGTPSLNGACVRGIVRFARSSMAAYRHFDAV